MSAEDKFEKGVLRFVSFVLRKARKHEAKTKNRPEAMAGLDEAIVDLEQDKTALDAKLAREAAREARAAAEAAEMAAQAAQARAEAAATANAANAPVDTD
jgi:hypothetical protein